MQKTYFIAIYINPLTKKTYTPNNAKMKNTTINKATTTPPLTGDWNHECWDAAETIEINLFRPESSDHQPTTEARLLYDKNGLHLIFRVQDKYVRSTHTEFNDCVCHDSCVEFFVKPKSDKGYINFETNCGGTLLASYVEDPTRGKNGFAKYQKLTTTDEQMVSIYHSMPKTVEPELTEPTTWINQLYIPFELFEKYVGELGDVSGQTWRANLYKCGDKTSHPHWVSWNPVTELNFHLPECFGIVRFSAS